MEVMGSENLLKFPVAWRLCACEKVHAHVCTHRRCVHVHMCAHECAGECVKGRGDEACLDGK